jgi:hypothetical protein
MDLILSLGLTTVGATVAALGALGYTVTRPAR